VQQNDLKIQMHGNSIQRDIFPGASQPHFYEIVQSAACQATLCCQQIFAVLKAMQQMQERCSVLQTAHVGMLLSNRPEPALQVTEAVHDMLVKKGHVGECTAEQHRSLEHAGATAILGC